MFYKAKVSTKKEERIWNSIDQITQILEELDLNKENITALELSSNSIGKVAAKEISQKIKNFKNLQYANFSDIFVSRKLDEIPEALESLTTSILDKHIRIVNFSNNAFGPIGIEKLSPFFISAKYLQELHIENCGLGPAGTEILSKSLLDNNNKIPLERLTINSNRLENKGAICIAAYEK